MSAFEETHALLYEQMLDGRETRDGWVIAPEVQRHHSLQAWVQQTLILEIPMLVVSEPIGLGLRKFLKRIGT